MQSTDTISTFDPLLRLPQSEKSVTIPNITSTTSFDWTKYPGNPVLNGGPVGSWDHNISTQSVLFRNGQYEMWYAGSSDTGCQNCSIGYAISPDGVNWIKLGSGPVLIKGPTGTWDSAIVLAPFVIFNNGSYKMWYRGLSDAIRPDTGKIGYAVSTDGINWIKYSNNPVLGVGPSGSWDDMEMFSSYVIVQSNIYKMWFSACEVHCQIGYATSSDGINWTKYAGNPVIKIGSPGSWDSFHVYYSTVIFNDNYYKMWYSGTNGSTYAIGYATSIDGITWNKHSGNPVLIPGPSNWESDFILDPFVLFQINTYKMWYSGGDSEKISRIGYATHNNNIYLPIVTKN
jgi:predicted GH43/DUF377 family glycosyl hydrolase